MTEVASGAGSELAAARAAYEQHDWPEARRLFQAAVAGERLSPEDLEAYGEASWWLAFLEEAISAREEAYAAHLAAGSRTQAAKVALLLFLDYLSRLQHSLAFGALDRAERQLEGEPEGPVHGLLLAMRASFLTLQEGGPEEALALAERAEALGHQFGDGDLESIALLAKGRTLVARGDVSEGMALLDKATVAAVGGELSLFTTGVVYCTSITACTELADYRRAGEWTEAAERWCHQQAVESGFPGMCRVYRAEIKRFQGDWASAEEEARRAAHELESSFLDVAGAAHNEIGEVRLRMGDLDGAERAFESAHEFGNDAQPGLSMLRLAQGRPDAAARAIRSALENPFLQPLGRIKLLPAQVEIAIATGDLETAASAAEQLAELAQTYQGPSPVLTAQAAFAEAAVALARDDLTAAMDAGRRALGNWRQARAPYEVARTRVLLARIHTALGDSDAAAMEARSARAAFQRLGANPDITRAGELLGDAVAGEHVVRTLMFTDIVTSTSLLEAVGDDAWADVLRWHDRTLREEFRAHGGEEVNHAGDGFLVAFPGAQPAIACAVAVQRRLDEHRRDHGFAPKVRIGIHTAETLRDAGDYRGKGVHEAARIAALAEGGEIIASKAALDAGGEGFAVTGTRTVTVKGIRTPIEVGTVSWERTVA